jgi:beta-N-acetylhexosaminidase
LTAAVFAADSLPEIQFIPLSTLKQQESPQKKENSPYVFVANDSSEMSIDNQGNNSTITTPYAIPYEILPLWESLSIRQKAAQMIMVFIPFDPKYTIEHEFGGCLISLKHVKRADDFAKTLHTINNVMRIKPFVAADQEGGIVNRLAAYSSKYKNIPSAKDMRKMSEKKIFSIAKKVSAVLDTLGINMNLAPVLDPAKDSKQINSFMEESNRSWGNDTLNASKVRAFVHGMRENNVQCVSKHFPGYDSWTNSDHQIAVSATPKKQIEKNVEFFKALSNDVPVTMMSSVRFIRISNRPAVFEPKIVKMAREISSETVILTDDLWGMSLRSWVSGLKRAESKNYPIEDFKKIVRMTIAAGNDMLMITYPQKAIEMLDYMEELSKQNKYYRERIEESSARIIKLKFKAGLINFQNQ